MVACICHSPLHHQKPDFEGQSVIKASSYLLPFVLEAHRESLPRSTETSARRLSAESAEVYSTADLPASAAHTFPSHSGGLLPDIILLTQGCYQWGTRLNTMYSGFVFIAFVMCITTTMCDGVLHVSGLFLMFSWCPCMAINVNVQYNGGLLPDIILLTQCYLHRSTCLNAMKRFRICSL